MAANRQEAQPLRKLRLNDAQWQKLQSLSRRASAGAAATPASASAGRLTSHGLVAVDRAGREYLTLLGMLRLSQGR